MLGAFNSVNNFSIGCNNILEYERIKREMNAFGIVPTGNIDLDKSKLVKVKNIIESNSFENEYIEDIDPYFSEEFIIKNQMEEDKKGADMLALLNRLYHNI